jgi:trehalose/maltose hydrolase-like predicted phosphorylase
VIEKRFAPRYLEQTKTIFTLANGYMGIRGAFEKGRPAFQNGTFINGNVAAELSLAGKPEPDTYLEAAKNPSLYFN